MDGAIALALALTYRKRITSKKERIKWSKQWFLNRAKFGHSELLKELRDNEPDDYKIFLRMDGDCFNELLEMVEPHNKKGDTVFAVFTQNSLVCTVFLLPVTILFALTLPKHRQTPIL
ncbi:hypothetical protein ElyMa_006619200 [Elysia marginata]|uniref:Uncharacterized protein n=1 Tax=Elysia marginata TaxID=1093978 RepID=A0AAV4IKJ0_9GAST|nr:hypothetical protein ElyMa_006619200 [Elysia marginata]